MYPDKNIHFKFPIKTIWIKFLQFSISNFISILKIRLFLFFCAAFFFQSAFSFIPDPVAGRKHEFKKSERLNFIMPKSFEPSGVLMEKKINHDFRIIPSLDSIKIKRPDFPQKIQHIYKTNNAVILFGPGPVPLWTSEFRLVYEITTSSHQSSYFGVSYIYKGVLFNFYTNQMVPNPQIYNLILNGFKVQLGHKFFLNMADRYAPIGFYFSPRFTYYTFIFGDKWGRANGYYLKAEHFDIVGLMGFQGSLAQKFIVDIFMGLGYKKNSFWEVAGNGKYVNLDISDLPLYNSPLKLVLGINYGIGVKGKTRMGKFE